VAVQRFLFPADVNNETRTWLVEAQEGKMKRLRTKLAVCLMALMLVGHLMPCQAVEPQKRSSKKLWWASVALVVAASVLDVMSSRGGMEVNPLMRGRDGSFNTRRAVMIKSISMGGMLATEALLMRKSPKTARSSAIANLVAGGAVTGLAIRNFRIQAAEPGVLARAPAAK
jgi:hypothetical protein